jgi:hypothetical protein
MKYLMLACVLMTNTAIAQTVINYPDGSMYTVKDNEKVYVTGKSVFNAIGGYNAGYFKFSELEPNQRRDYQQPEPPVLTGDEVCWPWGGVAAPAGYSVQACFVQEEEESEQCAPDGLSFGGGC